MNHDVFVSYSTVDKAVADAVVSRLETAGIRCWYAPRDIPPGDDWAGVISDAIADAKVMILIFSGGADRSQHVLDEVNLAIAEEKKILPFRIENLHPSGALRLHLSSRHWLDAYSPSWESHLDRLLGNVEALVGPDQRETQPAGESQPPGIDSEKPAAPERSNVRFLLPIGIVLGALLIAGLVFWKPWTAPETDDLRAAAVGEEEPTWTPLPTETSAPTLEPTKTIEPTMTVPPIPTQVVDDREIVYVGRSRGSKLIYDLHLASVDSSKQIQLTDDGEYKSNPNFSADGSQIVFSRGTARYVAEDKIETEGGDIFVMDVTGRNLRQLTENPWPEDDPAFSPDGKEIVYVSAQSGAENLAVMDSLGNFKRWLTRDAYSDRHPSFSPDGEWIAFASDRDGDYEIYLMDPQGDDLQQLTDNDWDDLEPVFHPTDSSLIVFYAHRVDHTSRNHFEIWLADRSAGSVDRLAKELNPFDFPLHPSPVFSPSGEEILYVDKQDNTAEGTFYYLMSLDGSDVRRAYVGIYRTTDPVFRPE